MKTKWVATRYARKFKPGSNYSVAGLLISMLFLIVSCDNGDDWFAVDNESPIVNEPPVGSTQPNIIYTDIDPDFNSEDINGFYDLDLNNDKITDFRLSGNSDSGYEWISIASYSITGNGIFSIAPWYAHPIPLDEGKKIYTLAGYNNGEFYVSQGTFTIGDCFGGEQGCFYDWKEKDDKYLGIRLKINGQIHYGWARLSVTNPTNWIIKDYAYNATPDSPILAGQVE